MVPEGSRLPWPSHRETRFHTHDALGRLVSLCWKQDPAHRPTMKDLLVELKEISANEVQKIAEARAARHAKHTRAKQLRSTAEEAPPPEAMASGDFSVPESDKSAGTVVAAMDTSPCKKNGSGSMDSTKSKRGCVIS
eukprot:scaffold82912_cov44-Prasinocladus_malaysianus.AAC.2